MSDPIRWDDPESLDEPCRLADCPPGLFVFDGTLCFRSEYTTTLENPRRYQPDAYIVESGEYFHGGAKNSEERSNLLVHPIIRNKPPQPCCDAAKELAELREALRNAQEQGFILTPTLSRLIQPEPVKVDPLVERAKHIAAAVDYASSDWTLQTEQLKAARCEEILARHGLTITEGDAK